MHGLNPQQDEAVHTTEGPLIILAGAGTGKTRVITFRIAHMLKKGISARNIVALTFTNKAAREMRDRAESIVQGNTDGLFIGTFHSFCLTILRRYPEKAGIDKRFKLIDTSDQVDFVRRALAELSPDGVYKAENLHAQISRAKNKLCLPDEIVALAREDRMLTDDPEVLRGIYKLYERQLKLNRVIDFDDCILKTVLLLRDHEDVRRELQDVHRYLLVDEFQDTNLAQLTVLEHLAGRLRNVCVVGDDDQSIYSWRGAMYETIERFEQIFKGAKLIKLEQNYRCSNVILGAANNVIKNNQQRKAKVLWSDSKIDNPIICAALPDDIEESQWIGDRVMGLLGQGLKNRDISVLYRINSQARHIEMALRERHVHYKTFGGQSFFERKEVKDFLGYLRLITHPMDHMALWRVINTPNRGVGMKTQEKIEEHAQKAAVPAFVLLARRGVDLGPKAQSAVDIFVGKIQKLGTLPLEKPEDLEALGRAILEEFPLESDIIAHTDNPETRAKKRDSLRQLPRWLHDVGFYMSKESGRIDKDELLDYLTLGGAEKEEDEEEAGNHVSLMSIHSAKGLEFPAVFVAGLEDELLPHRNSLDDPKSIDEERRLFYVAITRAKKHLHLTYALQRGAGNQRQGRLPSRFLAELPKDSLVSEGAPFGVVAGVKTQDELRQQTANRLAALKSSLSPKKG